MFQVTVVPRVCALLAAVVLIGATASCADQTEPAHVSFLQYEFLNDHPGQATEMLNRIYPAGSRPTSAVVADFESAGATCAPPTREGSVTCRYQDYQTRYKADWDVRWTFDLTSKPDGSIASIRASEQRT